MKNYLKERQKKIQKTHFSEIMQLFCCRKNNKRRLAPPYLRVQKLLKGLRWRVATICSPRFKNFFFATKRFHCTNNIKPIHICGVQIIIYFNFHGIQISMARNGVLTPSPPKITHPSPPPKKIEPPCPKNF